MWQRLPSMQGCCMAMLVGLVGNSEAHTWLFTRGRATMQASLDKPYRDRVMEAGQVWCPQCNTARGGGGAKSSPKLPSLVARPASAAGGARSGRPGADVRGAVGQLAQQHVCLCGCGRERRGVVPPPRLLPDARRLHRLGPLRRKRGDREAEVHSAHARACSLVQMGRRTCVCWLAGRRGWRTAWRAVLFRAVLINRATRAAPHAAAACVRPCVRAAGTTAPPAPTTTFRGIAQPPPGGTGLRACSRASCLRSVCAGTAIVRCGRAAVRRCA